MAEPGRILGNRVYCHLCEHEWDRANGGLQCPECRSEFVEIIEPDAPAPHASASESPPPIPPHPVHGEVARSPPPLPQHPLHDHNPWANVPDPDEGDITTFEFNTGRGHGTFSYSSRTYTFGGRDPAAEEIARNFESMLSGMMGVGRDHRRPTPTMGGGIFPFPNAHGTRGFQHATPAPGAPPNLFSLLFPSAQPTNQEFRQTSPLDFLSMLFNPGNGQHGDTVFTQEAFDRVMTQLMEQNQGTGAPPASEAAINLLKKQPLDKTMMGSDGTAECSICMDNVEVGDEMTFLPCNHWFHGDCVVSWLKEHDTCPHCRQPITNTEDPNPPQDSTRRSRRSRRSSSMATPQEEESLRYGPQVADSPTRERYYSSTDSPRSQRRSSRSDRGSDNDQGGVGGWFRSRMPF